MQCQTILRKQEVRQQNPKTVKIPKSELTRLKKLCLLENEARQQGFSIIAGVDEAGRGPLAGPVVAAACILPPDLLIPGIDDSKKLTADQRDSLYQTITSHPEVIYSVSIVDSITIDRINILQATIVAMLNAVNALGQIPHILLVDGMKIPHATIPSKGIIKGDSLSQSIAAASVLAKVTRDLLMREQHERYPHYGFDTNKGYGTAYHLEAIEKYGITEIHRKSFSPCAAKDVQLTLFE
jgi:ribonuclease HII